MKILVADDDAITRDMLEHVLTADGYEVETVADGSAALDVVRRGQCQIVISDWEMPTMDGLELCRRIRAENMGGYVYVILLTRMNEAKAVIAGFDAGADDYVTKPFEPAELRMRIRTGERILGLETRDVTIFALAKLAESRDSDTGAHLERVRSYSRALARSLRDREDCPEVDGAFVELIYQTSPLHDIGKVAIPDGILLKAASLSRGEREIMKTHAERGADTLDAALAQYPTAKFLVMARDIALTHHERWDGSGYPRRLAGESIPLCGRIVALADVYDALTSERTYKLAMPHADAREIIVKLSGTHFDPRVVDAFLATESEFIRIRDCFRELPKAETDLDRCAA
ncbi:MAG: response regulator [Phycisphaerales bacterium]|nr:response regulator [Phycisphaerae bacterium]NNF41617.1 response regulator [Phycisphaerales bacterium]NNM25351.1 response regulator [Phycisphaerales bacterium]